MGANFSPDRKYRYGLERIWNDVQNPKTVLFICLNPSTADEVKDDPTIRRCIQFSKDWGFDRLLLGNVFAFRSTDPKGLSSIDDPIGPQNDDWIAFMSKLADLTVVAWGNNKLVTNYRKFQVLKLLKNPHFLAINKNGSPKHPLYLKKDLTPKSIVTDTFYNGKAL